MNAPNCKECGAETVPACQEDVAEGRLIEAWVCVPCGRALLMPPKPAEFIALNFSVGGFGVSVGAGLPSDAKARESVNKGLEHLSSLVADRANRVSEARDKCLPRGSVDLVIVEGPPRVQQCQTCGTSWRLGVPVSSDDDGSFTYPRSAMRAAYEHGARDERAAKSVAPIVTAPSSELLALAVRVVAQPRRAMSEDEIDEWAMRLARDSVAVGETDAMAGADAPGSCGDLLDDIEWHATAISERVAVVTPRSQAIIALVGRLRSRLAGRHL